MFWNVFSILISVLVVAFLILCTIGNFVASKQLREAKKKIALIDDANQYATETKIAADKYSDEARKKADQYAIEKTTAADKYVERKRSDADEYKNKINYEINNLKKLKEELQKDIETLEEKSFVESVKVDEFDNLKSDEVKNLLAVLREKQKEMESSGKAILESATPEDRAGKRIYDNQKKQILRCFNAECKSIIESVTVKNIDSSRAKIQKSYDILNRIFATDNVAVTHDYLLSKLEELSLIYAYMVKREEESEQRKAIKAQMVEEEKVQREIAREKQKLEKEETQFRNEERKLMIYLQKSKDDVERQLYIDKINELQEQLKRLQTDKENVLQREQNTRAGFVYIISNIGSFGENIYKIGMTRRLEPMDRIYELSSASVPFPFDVHAMIFSEDAPGLEAVLHQYFDKKRVNKINTRKEFFSVDLSEIKKVVKENHNATVKFIDVPDAIEYRETLKMK